MRAGVYWIALLSALVLVAASCGSDDDDTSTTAGDDSADVSSDGGASDDGADDSDDGGEDPAPPATGGGGGGTLVLGDETIALDSSRCFLQEQDAAAGGGKILFVVQAFGTNADGDELVVDVSRYDEDSMFAGDDIKVDIGDPFSEDAVSFGANAPIGTVEIDGSTVSADGLTFMNFEEFTDGLAGSFTINC